MRIPPQIWIYSLILLAIGLAPGCRNTLPTQGDGSIGEEAGESSGITEKKVRLQIESEPAGPIAVPLKVTTEETNGAEVKVAIKPTAEAAQPIQVPVQIQPSASESSALKVPITVQPEAGETKAITVPFELKLNDEKKPISVPFELKLAGGANGGAETITVPVNLKLGGDAKEGGEAKTITVPIDLKLGGNARRELEIRIKPLIDVPKSIEIPMTVKPTIEGPRNGGVNSVRAVIGYLLLGIFMIVLGGVGGLLKCYFAATEFELAQKVAETTRDAPKLSTLESEPAGDWDERFRLFVIAERASIVYGMAAAALMPFLLYLVRGDVFTREGALVWLVLGSACLGAGFLGAGLLRHFDPLVLGALGGTRK